MSIKIGKLNKLFGNMRILNDISLEVKTNEMVSLLGPSGSGKTTLLRILAGLDRQNSGHIYFFDQDVSNVHAKDRKVGFVFQHYALFRHMTVIDNITFGMRILPRHKRPSSVVIQNKANQLLDMIQLSHLANNYPIQLSGGQKQRVALARSLAVEPNILLLDEPFGALDFKVRKELRCWLHQLHMELKFTSIFVTHDQEEAMEVSSKVVIMNKGNIEQIGTPQDVWCAPVNKFVLEFLGDVNKLTGEIRNSKLCIGSYSFPLLHTLFYEGKVDIFFRPWEMLINKYSTELYCLPVKIVNIGLRGYYYQVDIQPMEWYHHLLTVIVTNIRNNIIPTIGEYWYLSIKNARLYIEGKFYIY